MSKSQHLFEAKRIHVADGQRKSSTIRSIIFRAENATADAVQTLTVSERESLRRQVEVALARERRRANAKANSYDLSRHVNLYLLAKWFVQAEKQKGPVSGAQMKTT